MLTTHVFCGVKTFVGMKCNVMDTSIVSLKMSTLIYFSFREIFLSRMFCWRKGTSRTFCWLSLWYMTWLLHTCLCFIRTISWRIFSTLYQTHAISHEFVHFASAFSCLKTEWLSSANIVIFNWHTVFKSTMYHLIFH